MVICFQCPEDTKAKLDTLISEGHRDYAAVITAALDVYAEISKGLKERSSIVIGDTRTTSSASVTNAEEPIGSPPELSRGVPALFDPDGLERPGDVVVAEPDPERWNSGDRVPVDQWLFGQYNRLLPLKASIRGLARMLMDSPDGVMLEEAREELSSAAAELGVVLRSTDDSNGTSRDEALATAFPADGRKRDRSMERYAAHFVGEHFVSENTVRGFAFDMRMAGMVGEGPTISLTKWGWEFALLTSTVLDSDTVVTGPRLSGDERAFLNDHVQRRVYREHYAHGCVADAIAAGAFTPDALDEWLRSHLVVETSDITAAHLTTQRTGAIARMMELGKVRRIRDGVKASYVAG